ncbi:glycosyltransferase family 2 protein [Salarchaeum japonicum]|uniref:glycosyltransferase family 2 protein n=1 Tax=Salarchaeum japonicum TaxID=555573 RepID=UPI003C753F75
MSNLPLVSIVIPTYNRPDIFRETVASADAQSYSNIEIICIDDSDSEYGASVDVDNFVHITDHPHQNYGDALNTGLDYATGEYVMILDDDDTVSEDHVQTMMDGLSNGDYEGAFANLNLVDSSGDVIGVQDIAEEIELQPPLKELLRGRQVYRTLSGFVVNRNVVESMGGFMTEIPYWIDLEFYIRFLSRHSIYVSDTRSINYRIHEKQISGTLSLEEKLEGYQTIVDRNRDTFDSFGKDYYRYCRARHYLLVALDASEKSRMAALPYLIKMLRVYPEQLINPDNWKMNAYHIYAYILSVENDNEFELRPIP